MKCLETKEKEEDYLMTVKNKTLVVNMQHVKFKAIPPLKGPDPQGWNVHTKQANTIENSGNITGSYRQSPTKRRN